jgi:hypothetical protein
MRQYSAQGRLTGSLTESLTPAAAAAVTLAVTLAATLKSKTGCRARPGGPAAEHSTSGRDAAGPVAADRALNVSSRNRVRVSFLLSVSCFG